MREFIFRMIAARGLHAQLAAELAQIVQTSKSQVYLTKGLKSVNMGRIMEVMSLGIGPGDEVRVTVVGEDEENLCECLKEYFELKL